MTQQPVADLSVPLPSDSEHEILLTLFDLGRKIASVIDLDELLAKIPELVRRLIPFDAFAVYLYKGKRDELVIAHAVGYPPDKTGVTIGSAEGLLGRVVTTQQPVVLGDVTADPHYLGIVPDMMSTLAVPLIHKAQSIG